MSVFPLTALYLWWLVLLNKGQGKGFYVYCSADGSF